MPGKRSNIPTPLLVLKPPQDGKRKVIGDFKSLRERRGDFLLIRERRSVFTENQISSHTRIRRKTKAKHCAIQDRIVMNPGFLLAVRAFGE
mmetsp:Transcript_11860/g.27467  ORF Transcript_11860/g.27467 Transcript_11860/m.27467 type:complete len:91 (-) Transcript_11860:1895-2167(-)